MKIFFYLSEIIGQKVIDERGARVGSLCDIVMKLNGEIYPKASGLIVRQGIFKKRFALIPMEEVAELEGSIKLKTSGGRIFFEYVRTAADLSLSRDILDQQVVDTDNQKVVRVNDIHLLRVDRQLYLAHVDVSTRGLVRRLEWTPLVDGLVRLFKPDSPYLKQEELISWKNTQVLTLGRTKNVLKLDVARQKLAEIPHPELAEILAELDIFECVSVFKSLDVFLQRKVFASLSTDRQKELVDRLNDKEAIGILENIPPDDAADLLLRLPRSKTLKFMRLIETKAAKKLWKLLGFSQDSAGGMMTTEYLSLPSASKVKDAMQKIKDPAYSGNTFHIYIVDAEHHLLGGTTMKHFINADPEKSIMDVCYPAKVFVRTEDQLEEIALTMEKYQLSSVPVLNEEDVLQGVVAIDDVLERVIALAWSKYRKKR